ncbi:transcriptional regulator [Psychrobacillus sp. INOP01]|uniref:transcriptional regulator n=1 Tax=Psychrobacillus sp. INOP01 TaxID=2829187 RepID=UPI001BA9CA56|nr:transcriptional regulator [Psychrobacillus sp. INOP01]QUG41600.1 transcriptional regulator [Psychrobacillus sp. INOP01]
MRNDLVKYFNRGWIVELIYVSKAGEISKRKVRILKIQGDIFYAYCLKQKAKRTFLIDHVLALVPILPQERGAI